MTKKPVKKAVVKKAVAKKPVLTKKKKAPVAKKPVLTKKKKAPVVIPDRLDPEIKRIWVETLRSGDFTQGKDHLKLSLNGKLKHCCLGVLCEVLQLPEVKQKSAKNFVLSGFTADDDPNDLSYNQVPMSVAEAIGLKPEHVRILMDRNDGVDRTNYTGTIEQWDFPTIADYIEKNL